MIVLLSGPAALVLFDIQSTCSSKHVSSSWIDEERPVSCFNLFVGEIFEFQIMTIYDYVFFSLLNGNEINSEAIRPN
ncbi:hypothetical protein BDF20DRAFT_891582 [Mycotypha africana]|uniref:uncharacterized protein n=1 Tax=Mycotypha africana TaxID=64632 RepID=UPI00230044D2|nr:uncharacterized protein BDF20DRAFT_891582 [Mycotypha africana]KAI8970479.1 hypothetical protein BDF20DRAFT_891582 [Mycotypha africana]